MLPACCWADICGQLFPKGTGSFIIRLSVSNAFCSFLTPPRSAELRVSAVAVMFDSCWPEVTGAKEGLGLVWACLFSTEEFWIMFPLQQALQGHAVLIAGRCMVASSLLSPWDKAGPRCLGTQQEWPPWFPLCQECSGEQPELLAKKSSLLLTFSLFQILSWSEEWSLPFQCQRSELWDPKCRFAVAPLQHRG